MKKSVCIILITCFLFTMVAAQKFEVSGKTGMGFLEFENSFLLGLMAGMFIFSRLMIMTEIVFFLNTYKNIEPKLYDYRAQALSFCLAAMYTFVLKNTRIIPYVILGIGMMNLWFYWNAKYMNWIDRYSKSKFMWNIGLGFKYPIAKNYGLLFDIRYIFIATLTQQVLRLTIGLYFQF